MTKDKKTIQAPNAETQNNAALKLLLSRRSVVVAKLGTPGPTSDELDNILAAGLRVPDHKIMAPWRFLLFLDEARQAFGEVLAATLEKQNGPLSEKKSNAEKNRFMRAPVVIAVISRPQMGVVPEWEQILSAGAACQNILNAVQALGYAAQWITEWYAYDPSVAKALGLEGNEKIAGFIYIGTAQHNPTERRRPALEELVERWQPPE